MEQKLRFTIYLNFQFEPITLEVTSFMWKENGDLELYDGGKYWFIPYNSLKFVYSEVIR